MGGDFNMNIKELPKFLGKSYMKTKTKGTCCISGQRFNFVDKSVLRGIYNLKNIIIAEEFFMYILHLELIVFLLHLSF